MKNILIVFLSLWIAGYASADNSKNYDTMVVFGDSLSDNGNLYNYLWHTLPASPPYYQGHFSNGPVWVEQLYDFIFPKEQVGSMQNYAVGGAGAVLARKQNFPYTLAMELDNYLYLHTYGKKSTTLFAIWIGGNNYLNAPTHVEALTDSVVNAIGSAVERLIKAGGNKFFISNLPDLAKIPFVNEYGTQAIVHRLVLAHNQKLAIKIDELRDKYPDATIVYFDVYSFFSGALEHAGEYGFTETVEPCYLGGYIDWFGKNQVSDERLKNYVMSHNPEFDASTWPLINENPQLKEAATASYLYRLLPKTNQKQALSCDEYVFWDRIHPSTRAHEIIAKQAQQLLEVAGLAPFVPDKELN